MKSWERKTQRATPQRTRFSRYMLTLGTEKAIPSTYLYPEFSVRSFESHGVFVVHVPARLLDIHDLVRRNTHQTQQRQKLKYERAVCAKAYNDGDRMGILPLCT